ncbi:MAG: hypothetical protein ACYSWU_17365 [Planctomycetota bacterium]|jgi:chemotaxis protein histidine kinase CheA
MMATIPEEVEITDISAVEHVKIPLQAGKITVLRARNGKGKTKALEAIAAGAGRKGRLDVRDGALAGQVKFGDQLTLRVGRSTTRKGELVVNTLEGKFKPGDIVDPGFKDAGAADAARIKGLLQLAHAKADATIFYPLVGGKKAFEQYVSPRSIATDDVIEMAAKIKRDLEAGARTEEEQAEYAEGHARGAKESAEGVDVGEPDDPDELQAALESAIRTETALAEQVQTAEADVERRQEARDALEDAEADYDGQTVQDANESVRVATAAVARSTKALQEAEEALAKAKALSRAADGELRIATKQLQAAQSHEKTVSAWREQVEKPAMKSPPASALDAATGVVFTARKAVETGALVRQAKVQLARARQFTEKAKEHAKAAAQLREAAKGTDEVLSGIVATLGCPLRVEAGRLVLDTHRGATYFSDLSHGERWKLTLDIAIEAVGPNGLLPIEQEAFEGLDPENRRLIADHVEGSSVAFVTAEATDDVDLKAEFFDASTPSRS